MILRYTLSILATVAVLVVSVAYLAGGVLNVRPFTDKTTITITAPKTNGLHAGSAVVYRGVPIGDVEKVSYTGDAEVLVTVSYDAAYRIPVNSDLVIENQSMLGETAMYLAPAAAGGPYIGDGRELSARVVEVPASVPELLGSARTVLDQVDPSLVNDLVDTVAQALAGTKDAVQRLTPAAQLVSATMIYSQPALVKIIRNATTMMADGEWIGSAMRPTKPELLMAGQNLYDVITHVKPFADFTNGGEVIAQRWKPTLERSAETVGELVPPISRFAQTLVPTARTAGSAIFSDLNIATLLEQAMRMLPGDALRLAITPK
ncbi:MlaD family protein [Gordonia zhaorongruii]|uniref:MlaD family protein n=1 Tax=Gordonia zhaorongruii TaxID=2597659 RepID=UPI00104BE5ED|nr:MlaD family protein [Gordonia zhaorongruii]